VNEKVTADGTVMSMTTDKKFISKVTSSAPLINVPATKSTKEDFQPKWENFAKDMISVLGLTIDAERRDQMATATSFQSPITIMIAYMRAIGDAGIAHELMLEYADGKSPPKAMSLLERGTLTITGDSVLGFKNKKSSTYPEAALREMLDPGKGKGYAFCTQNMIGDKAWRVKFGWPEGYGNTIYLKHCVEWLIEQHTEMLEENSDK
jgi:hypothetical protein